MSEDPDRATHSISNEIENKLQCSTNINPARESKMTRTLKTNRTFRAPEVQASRLIDAKTNHEVQLKNGDRGCDFVSPVTLKRCGSKFQLQRDHIKPFSEGGSSSPENLRIYCGAHNRWVWRNRPESLVRYEPAALE